MQININISGSDTETHIEYEVMKMIEDLIRDECTYEDNVEEYEIKGVYSISDEHIIIEYLEDNELYLYQLKYTSLGLIYYKDENFLKITFLEV